MSGRPINDRLKVRVSTDKFGFGGAQKGVESGIVVEVPNLLIYLSFHSFAFEKSFDNPEAMEIIQGFYSALLNKRIFWETFQDRGRRFREGDDEYVYIQMTDVLFYADNVDDDIQLAVDQGGFNPA